MAKRPQTHHGKALAAFTSRRITRKEYMLCCMGQAVISGSSIHFMRREIVGGRLVWYRPIKRLLGNANG